MSLRFSAAKEIRIVLSFTKKVLRCLRKRVASDEDKTRKDSDATASAALILLSQVPGNIFFKN